MARPRKPILSPELIVSTALDLVDRTGRFTVPEIAQQLGVSVSSLYHHLGGRAEIVEGIRGLLVAQMPFDEDAADWREAVRDYARGYRSAFAAHPAVIPLLVSQTISHPDVLARYDALADLLHDRAGLIGEDLVVAITMIDNLCLGAALDVGAPSEVFRKDRDSRLTQAFAGTSHAARAELAFERQLAITVAALERQIQPA